MYITMDHFLSPFIAIIKDNELVERILAVDTELLVAVRLSGFDNESGQPQTDLIKIDEVIFLKDKIPENLKYLLGSKLLLTSDEEFKNKFQNKT